MASYAQVKHMNRRRRRPLRSLLVARFRRENQGDRAAPFVVAVGSAVVSRGIASFLLLPAPPRFSASAGMGHSLVLAEDGSVFSFGRSNYGRLGHGDDEKEEDEDGDMVIKGQLVPKRVEALHVTGRRITQVSVGAEHSLVLAEDGAVLSFGHGRGGQLGHGERQSRYTPTVIASLVAAGRRIAQVSAGNNHSLVLAEDGAVLSFGYGGSGMLGHGDEQHRSTPTVIASLVAAGRRIAQVSAGDRHSLVLAEDGAVLSFGSGGYGQLGHGDEKSMLIPTPIASLLGLRVNHVSAGSNHSLVSRECGVCRRLVRS